MQAVDQTITVPAGANRLPRRQLVVYCSANSANFINVYFTVNGGPEQFQSVAVSSPGLRDDPILCPK